MFLGAFLRSGRPRGPGKAFKNEPTKIRPDCLQVPRGSEIVIIGEAGRSVELSHSAKLLNHGSDASKPTESLGIVLYRFVGTVPGTSGVIWYALGGRFGLKIGGCQADLEKLSGPP